MKIRVSGGTKDKNTLLKKFKLYFPSCLTGGTASLLKIPTKSTYNMYRDTRTKPGRNAPRNIFPALTESTLNWLGIFNDPVEFLYSAILILSAASEAEASWSDKIINTIEGGIIWPKVPDEHTIPDAKDLL